MSMTDKVPAISAIQLKYDKGTGEYTILIGISASPIPPPRV